jgi:pyrimidine operon attenuation protein/uracil phosphoribosyltransferase
MEKLLLLSGALLDLTVSRLCQQLIENHVDFQDTVMVGMQPRGRFFAARIVKRLYELQQIQLPLGELDTTFYRDDFRRRDSALKANATYMPFVIENKNVILVDDVLYTGRTIRAALSALSEFGRPKSVELMVLIDRIYSRDVPIQPNYVGRAVNTVLSQKVLVEWTEQGAEKDAISLIERNH